MDLSPGSVLGSYRIVAPLGRGGMAAVYKAYDPALDRDVALKVLPPEFLHDPAFAERFRQEARVAAKLEHQQIVPIHAYGIDDGRPWMAMRLVKGGALADRLRRGPLSPGEAARLLRDVAGALDYAHARGVVHRDVKPANVLLDEGGRAYLADFGIAKMLEGSAFTTATGFVQGTPSYMAPEQAMGSRVDRLADVYALGIVAFECLTGRVPYTGTTPVAVLMKHVQDPVPEPVEAEVPRPLTAVLRRCLAKTPAERWASAGAFAEALELAASGTPPPQLELLPTLEEVPPVSATPRTGTVEAPRPQAPSGRTLSLLAGGCLAALALAAGAAWLGLRSAAPPTEAQQTARPPADTPEIDTPALVGAAQPPSTPGATPAPARTEPRRTASRADKPPPTPAPDSPANRAREPTGAAPDPDRRAAPEPEPAPATATDDATAVAPTESAGAGAGPQSAAAAPAGAGPRKARAGKTRVFLEAKLEPVLFKKTKSKDVTDSLEDLVEAIRKRGVLELAATRGEADAVVQVLERGREPAVIGARKLRVRVLLGRDSVELAGQDSLTGFNTWSGAANGAAKRVEAWLAARLGPPSGAPGEDD